MTTTSLMDRSKTALAGMVERSDAAKVRAGKAAEVLGEKLMDTVGGGTALATAAMIGLAEGRISNKDGSALSLGPVPLTLAAAGGLTTLSWFWNPNGQVAYAAAGAFGGYGVTLGRVWGRTWKGKARVSGVGDDDDIGITAAEHALINDE